MPPEAKKLADLLLHDPAHVAVTPVSSTAETIDQRVYFVEKSDKRSLLKHLLGDPEITRALVFTRTKHGADRVTDHLRRAGVEVDAIHGNKSQGARERALARLKGGHSRVLVATDIAARGIDIDDVSHVVNFDLPNVPETYVHRIGRTARAGASGVAFSFCDAEERAYLRDIEKLTRRAVTVVPDHPFPSTVPMDAPPRAPAPRPSGPRQGGRHDRHGHDRHVHAQGQARHGQGHGAERPGHAQGHERSGQAQGHDRPQKAHGQDRPGHARPGHERSGHAHGQGHAHGRDRHGQGQRGRRG
jgi:ATP-dependent RNA helicase RhlE